MANIYRLNESIHAVGGFWPPRDPEQILNGTLISERGEIQLEAAPEFKRIGNDQFYDYFAGLGINAESRQIGTLWGHTREGRCTLFHLMETIGQGLSDAPNQIVISAERWRVGGVVMGLHLDSSETPCIDAAAFYLNKIHNLLPAAKTLNKTEDGTYYLRPSKTLTFFQFNSSALDGVVVCEIFPGRSTNDKSVPRIKITPRKPQSVDWFFTLGHRIENFFSLLLGTSVARKSIQFFQGEKNDGWLIRKTMNPSEKIDYGSWARLTEHQMAQALEKWFAVPEDERSAERTLFNIIRKSSLFVETEFLALAQALEGYGRIRFDGGLIPQENFKAGLSKLKRMLKELWGESDIAKRCEDALSHTNETAYAQKVGQAYDLLSVEFSNQLLGNRADFVRKVVQTRNYFTHLGGHKGGAVIDGGKTLSLFNYRLHAFLRCVMLLDLGIPEQQLREPILHQATKWR